LQAEQALDRIAQHAAGTGSMEESAQKQFMNQLRRAANQGRGAVEKVTAASLALMRIAVETIEPAKEGDHDD
jgi:hypothetical protein